METVAAIGAPIYGSDAIAGTINIILKRNYEGVDLDVQSGVSIRGDAPDYRVRFLAGKNFAGGRGNITISGEYNQSKGLFFNDRRVTSSDDRFDVRAVGIGAAGHLSRHAYPVDLAVWYSARIRFHQYGPRGAVDRLYWRPRFNVGVVNAGGQQLKFDQFGNLIPIDFGTVVGATADGSNIFSSGGNGFTLRDVENLLTDVKRYSANVEASFDITSKIRLFGEGWYSVSQGRNLANQPVYNSALFGSGGLRDGNLILSINNPFLSPAARATIINSINNQPFSDQNLGAGPQDYFYLGRANVDLSSGVSTGKSEIMRFVGGVDGKVNVVPAGDWRFEAYFNYGRSTVTSRNPELNEQNFVNAIGGITAANPNGIPCLAGYTNSPVATQSATCAAINPFGNQVSDAAKAYITTIATPRNLNKQYDAVASVSGPLFKLPGGDFSFALGFEHRAESSRFTPGAFYQGATTDQYPGIDFDGDGDRCRSFLWAIGADPAGVREIPYQRNLWRAQRRSDFGQERHSRSSTNCRSRPPGATSGTRRRVTTRPIRCRPFRADPRHHVPRSYTRAVRAPSITEAFNPSSSAFGFATDVCDKSLRTSGPDPRRVRRTAWRLACRRI